VTEVLLVRHGQVSYDPQAVAGDMVDPPLTEQGRQQARLLGEALSTKHLSAIFVSPLRRAMETAEAIVRHHRNIELEVVRDLREVEVFRDVPPDKTLPEFLGADLLAATRHRMLEERSWDVYPYTEPSYEFRKRVINAVEAAIARNAGERIAIVCHGGVINAYTGHIIRSPYDMFFRPAHTSVSIVAAGGGRRVIRLLNDTHHLTTAEGDFATY
jgi:broad specificity phosphatase PhoE